MSWNKTKIHSVMRMHDRLELHVFDTFFHWWETKFGDLRSDTPEWDKFWEDRKMVGDNYFEFDWKTKEWIVRHGTETYRFQENWLYDDLDKEPDLVMLWHSNYYDGPLSGMALYNGKYAWFDCFADDHDDGPYAGLRAYYLYELSEDEIKDEFDLHDLFRKYVGYHCDYGSAYAPFDGKSAKDMDKFYKEQKKRKPRDYKQNKILAEVSDVQFRRDRPLTSVNKEGNLAGD